MAAVWNWKSRENVRFVRYCNCTLKPAKVQVIIKAHILAGEDAISKLGSKRAAIALNSDEFLRNCGEPPTFKED